MYYNHFGKCLACTGQDKNNNKNYQVLIHQDLLPSMYSAIQPSFMELLLGVKHGASKPVIPELIV